LGVPLLFIEEFEVVIMIAVSDRRDAWVGPKAEPENDYERAWVGNGNLNKSEMALFPECTHGYASKMLDTADIVREASRVENRRSDFSLPVGM